MGRLIEGLWDCPYCDTKGILGRERVCPICSKERGEHTKFYMGNPEDYVVSKTEEVKISKEPDWLCSYCDSYNVATSNKCFNCGHLKDEGDISYFEKHKEKEEQTKEIHYNQPINEIYTEPYVVKENNNIYYSEKKNWFNILKLGGIGLVIFSFIWLMCFLFIPKEAQMTITDIAWEYQLNIEEYRTVEESDWLLPPGGRLIYSQSEIHHYQEVLDHYETKTKTYTEQVFDHYETVVTGYKDLGNGYFEEITSQQPVYRSETKTETYQEPIYRSEPIFQTKYYYEIDKWVYDRTIKSEGHDKNTYYGKYVLDDNEREGSKYQDYNFTGITEKDSYTFQVTENEWNNYDVGDVLKVKINALGMVSIVGENP